MNYKRLRRFVKLLMSRNLRRRLERFQIAHGRVAWTERVTIGKAIYTTAADLEILFDYIESERNNE